MICCVACGMSLAAMLFRVPVKPCLWLAADWALAAVLCTLMVGVLEIYMEHIDRLHREYYGKYYSAVESCTDEHDHRERH